MDFAIVDIQSSECCENMFDHFNGATLGNQGCSPRAVDSILNNGWNPWLTWKVGSHEDDATIGFRRLEFQFDVPATPESVTGNRDALGNRSLFSGKSQFFTFEGACEEATSFYRYWSYF